MIRSSCVLAVPTVPLHLVNRKDKCYLLVKASGQVLSSGALQGLLPCPGLFFEAADQFLQWAVSLRTGAQHLQEILQINFTYFLYSCIVFSVLLVSFFVLS